MDYPKNTNVDVLGTKYLFLSGSIWPAACEEQKMMKTGLDLRM